MFQSLDVNNMFHIGLIIILCFIFTLLITFVVKKIAIHIGAMDIPNERKIHKKPMPRLGGLAIFLGFLFGYIIFGQHSVQMNSILIGGFLIILIGMIDDVKPLNAKIKFGGQILAALVLILYGNFIIKDFTLFGLNFDLKLFAYPLTLLFILGCINIMNLIDGLDGLCCGTCTIFYITIGIIAIIKGNYSILTITLTFIMLGSTLGFLVHNFYPAKIFLGDSGSMFQGFMIATISLMGFKTATLISLFVPLLILGIPVLDTLFAIIRRTIKKQPIYLPDKCHLHHQLLNLGLSHRNTVLCIYGMNILFASASIIFTIKDRTLGLCSYIIIFLLIVWIVTKTSIIADRKHPINYDLPKNQNVKNKSTNTIKKKIKR